MTVKPTVGGKRVGAPGVQRQHCSGLRPTGTECEWRARYWKIKGDAPSIKGAVITELLVTLETEKNQNDGLRAGISDENKGISWQLSKSPSHIIPLIDCSENQA